ncbi:ribonuclease J [Leptotrichia sp. oral taxon 847]|uniref:ribonuclease J n=1 Tax=Leptotrichia sp. oral taxon 847 TaxID=1785996 RepID=UPI0007681307|nr:ribonuclease J [Leptotrichia sp. oral taxon 847]AMD94985.1 ribonuclease J [Leptotrichia sp. oral taxon 847]
MSDREKREAGNSNSTIKRYFSKKEDTNKIKSNLKRFRRKNTNRRHLDEKNETRYVPLANNRNRHVDKKNFKDETRDEKMYVIPLGGLEEVGKNMTAFQYKDEIIVVDAGLTFPEDEHLGIDVIIPDFAYLEANKNKIKGLLLTHGHEDHIGAVPYFYQKLGTENIPMYGGKLTLALAKAKFEKKDAKLPKEKVITGRNILKISKYFTVEFISVTHSIADCYAICIKTPAATILHSGDFKVDLTPVDGEGFDFGRLAQLGEEGVDLLLSDSTNAQIPGFTPSERTVGESLKDEFSKAKGRIILAAFASHVHRLQQIVNIAHSHGRKIAIDGRSMIKIFEICSELGYLKLPKDIMIDIEKVETHPADKVLILCTGTQGEPLAALSRIANGTHKYITLRQGDTVVISATPIPGNEKAATKNINQLMKRDASVVFEKGIGIHVSGHGCQEEQKLMINLVKPKFFLPVHGEYAMIKKHKELAVAVGVEGKNVLLAENGAKFELSRSNFRQVGRVPSGATFIDGFGIGDVGNAVLKDRQNLADDGIVIISILKYKNGTFNKNVELVTRGFVYNKDAESLLSKTKELVKKELCVLESEKVKEIGKIKQRIRVKIGDFLIRATDRDPIILPIIMDN